MSLAAMIAKQKEVAAAKAAGATSAASHQTPDIPTPTPTPATGGAKLTFGVKKPAASGSGTIPPVSPASKSIPQVVEAGAVMSLDDLSDSEDAGEPQRGSTTSGMAFDDEIPCTAPERELPPELTDSQLQFVQQLDSIYEIVHDPELFGSQIRTIMQELQECPDYMKLVADQDVHTMIRGLRSSMGLAKIKKAEKSTKARGAKKAPPTHAMVATADEIFNAEDW